MSNAKINAQAQLDAAVQSAWSDLETFLAMVKDNDATARDAKGWTVKDHVTHMAVWGDSVAVLFRGGSRHEALGIEEDFYSTASFDQINEIIRQRESHLSLSQSIDRLREVHRELMKGVHSLPEADLARTVRDVFPLAPRTDDRRVVDLILENTAAHYIEHLPWMKELVVGPA